MARLASQVKAGYYPIPPEELQFILNYIQPNKHGGRILDPVAGKGAALATLAMKLQYEAYANELNAHRAAETKRIIDVLRNREMPLNDESIIRTVHGDIAFLTVSMHSIQIMYLNPPYDWDQEDKRLELKFLKTANRWLQPGGVLIFVVPESAITIRETQRYIASFFNKVTIKRFSDANYETFKQHIIIGYRNQKAQEPSESVLKTFSDHFAAKERYIVRADPIEEPEKSEDEKLKWWLGEATQKNETNLRDSIAQQAIFGPQNWPQPEEKEYVPVIDWRRMPSIAEEPDIIYKPVAPKNRGNFNYFGAVVSIEDVELDIQENGVHQTKEYADLFAPADENMENLDPLMPMKQGHLARIIAAGMLDSVVLDNGDERVMIKGTTVRNVVMTGTVEVPRKDKEPATKATYQEVPQPRIMTLDEKGVIEEIEPENTAEFLIKWMPELTKHVEELYPPRYRFDFAGYKELIGDRASLFTAQKHAVAAVCLQLEKTRDAIISGEMGSGKTRMGAVVIAAMQYRRALVAVPPHLVSKWKRELKIAIPECKVMHLETVSDVDTWMERDEQKTIQVGIIKFTTVRAASGWRHAVNYWELITEEENEIFMQRAERIEKLQPVPVLSDEMAIKWRRWLAWRKLKTRRGVRFPSTGAVMKNRKGIPYSYKEIMGSTVMREKHRVAHPERTGLRGDTDKNGKPKQYNLSRVRTYYDAAYQYTRSRDPEMPTFKDYARMERQLFSNSLSMSANGHKKPVPIGADRYPSGAKTRLAQYIKKKYRYAIDITIYDEVQKLKGADSAQGIALGTLASASKKNLSMTGTIYGGKASTIFHILYRTSDEVREAFTDKAAKGTKRMQLRRWLDLYGMASWTVTESEEPASRMSQSGTRRTKSAPKEAPGSAPGILPWLLNRTVFISLADMGKDLPPFKEHAVPIVPEQAMLDNIMEFEMEFGSKMRKRLAMGDRGLLGAYLWAMIGWPDSPWRDEIITDPKTRGTAFEEIVGHIPKIRPFQPDKPETYHPKEREMVERAVQESKKGRGVVICCLQTQVRDITDQWTKMLKRRGLSVAVLNPSSVTTAKRESWIKKHEKKGTQVIITHPRSIETGLDLYEYPTIFWMMIDYSVYTVLQTSRRPFRIGQDKEVHIYYFYYQQTMQEQAVKLVAEKAAAAYQTTGDNIDDGSLAGTVQVASIEAALMDMLASGQQGLDETHTAQDYFDKANQAARTSAKILGGFSMSAEEQQEDDDDQKTVVVIEGEFTEKKEQPASDLEAATEEELELLKKMGYMPQELFLDPSEVLGDTYRPELY